MRTRGSEALEAITTQVGSIERGAQGLLIIEVQHWQRVRVDKTPRKGIVTCGIPEAESDMRKLHDDSTLTLAHA